MSQWQKLRRKSSQAVTSSDGLELPSSNRTKSTSTQGTELGEGETESRESLGPHEFLSVPDETEIKWLAINPAASRKNPLGLTLLHGSAKAPSADIVFVHGLGGTSQQTWSWKRDAEFFWPGKWLPQEPDISMARLFTFGYDADFKSSKSGILSGINDFAKDLLFSLKFSKTETSESLDIGKRPIVFVAHSMGGLVVKKACIIGQHDEHYHDLVSNVKAILFLSTPHRGSNLADILNRILSISPAFSHSPKRYMAEISQHSAALEEMNEQFRNTAPKLQIFCFYETLHTPTGPAKLMIVEKDSSILGYPGEISKPLRADHHNVCKYESRFDENYVSVRNTLQTLVLGYKEELTKLNVQQLNEEMREIEAQLMLTPNLLPDDDHTFFTTRRTSGTCQGILSEQLFIDWCKNCPKPSIIWLNLPPASGKSILTSFIIDHLRSQGYMVQYFYVRFGDQTKRSIATILKSFACQLARQLPEFRVALKALLRVKPSLGTAEARAIWQNIFVSQLFTIEHDRPIFWLLDGLDEADLPQNLLELLSNLTLSRIPIRILISSRRSSQLSHSFSRLSKSINVDSITFSSVSTDMRIFAQQELDQVPWQETLKMQVIERILQRAEGNFLWVNLVLQEIVLCHTPEAIDQAMEDIPPDMEQLYRSMESSLLRNLRRGDIPMCRDILSWAALSKYPLHVDQIVEAIHPDFSSLLDPKFTIGQVCGQFAAIDGAGRIVMSHQTAREYILTASGSEIALDSIEGHTQHAARCLSALVGPAEQSSKRVLEDDSFFAYAVSSWFYHLKSSDVSSNRLLNILVKFFSSRSVLDWVRALACGRNLKYMVQAAQVLAKFAGKRRKHDAEKSPMLHRLTDLDLLENWSVDLVRVVGKFGLTLQEEPDAIYKLIPAFCPRDSVICSQFVETESSRTTISLSGIHNKDWDDNIARIAVCHGARAELIRSSLSNFAISTSNLRIIIWDAINFEKLHELKHNEPLVSMCFTSNGNLLATVGFHTSKIWNVGSGEVTCTIDIPPGLRALTASFTNHDTAMMIGFDDSSIRVFEIQADATKWEELTTIKSQGDYAVPGLIQSSPSSMAFNSDGAYVAVASRGSPLSVWQISTSSLIGRCGRNKSGHRLLRNDWTWVDHVCWHPFSGEVLGIYMDGCIFKWHPFNDQHEEIQTNASEIECSPEGTIFITSDSDGYIKLYNFHHFALIYQLSGDDIISDLTISPDCKRFYDIRGSHCNAWEPNVLTRLNEAEDTFSESKSTGESLTITATASEAFVESRTMITALIPLVQDKKIILGTEEGVTCLYDYATQSMVEVWRSSSMMAIEQLSANDDETLFISGDLGGAVAVNRLSRVLGSKNLVHHVDSIAVNENFGRLTQVLCHAFMNLLLVAGREGYELWSIPSGEDERMSCQKTAQNESFVKFVTNPSDSSQVLGFTGSQVSIKLWKDLTTVIRLSLDSHLRTSLYTEANRSEAHSRVVKVLASADKSFVIIQTSPDARQSNAKKQAHVIPSSEFSAPNVDSRIAESAPIRAISIPQNVSETIEVPLAVLDRQRLVYLDKNFWVCTWHMGPSIQSKSVPARRHFPVPRDWIEPEGLKLCCLTVDAAFLYPKNGEVGTIYSSDIARGW